MRAMKKTSLNFGLVNIPVRMYKATESHDIRFNTFHAGCNGPMGQVRKCKECAEIVEYTDIVKGMEYDGQLVFVTQEELDALEGENSNAVEVVQFCQADEVDPLMWEASYYLEPDGLGDGYALLRQIMEQAGRVAVVRFVMRTRATMGIVRVLDNVLVVHTMHWMDEIRSVAELKGLDREVTAKPQMIKMAHALMDNMTEYFEPTKFIDTYADRLRDLIAAKAESGEVTLPVKGDSVVDLDGMDLMAKLEASVAAHPANRRKTPAKKPVARKAAPRRKSA